MGRPSPTPNGGRTLSTTGRFRAATTSDSCAAGRPSSRVNRCTSVSTNPSARDPAALLRDLFAFLGVNPDVDLSAFPLTERILPGPPGELSPSLGRFLHRLLHDRAVQLAAFLEERFGLKPPAEWQAVLDPTDGSFSDPHSIRGELNDADLSRVLGQEATFPLAHRLLVEDHYGYRIVFHRGRLFAVARDAAHVNLHEAGEAELTVLAGGGLLLHRVHLGGVKGVRDPARPGWRRGPAPVGGGRPPRRAAQQTALLAARLDETARALAKLGGDALRLSAKEHALVRRSCAAASKPCSGPGGGCSPRSPQAPGKPALTARPGLWDRRGLLTSAPYRASPRRWIAGAAGKSRSRRRSRNDHLPNAVPHLLLRRRHRLPRLVSRARRRGPGRDHRQILLPHLPLFAAVLRAPHPHRLLARSRPARPSTRSRHPAVRETLRYLRIDRGVEMHHDGDLPARSGMGSSSAFTVGLLHALHALRGEMATKRQLAQREHPHRAGSAEGDGRLAGPGDGGLRRPAARPVPAQRRDRRRPADRCRRARARS